MDITIAIIIAVLFVTVVMIFAISMARRVQRGIDKLNKSKSVEGHLTNFLSHWHSFWWIGGAVIGGFKYAYKAWRKAPSGSWSRFGWGMILAAIIAVLCWLVVYIIDRKLNGGRKTFKQMLWTPEESNERPTETNFQTEL